jgi:inosine-uridine nucleoside N-ribohydrolase
VWLSGIDIEAICAPAPGSELARLLRESVAFYADFYASTGRYEGACMHDPLAVAAAIDPSLCTWADTRVEVELGGRWTRGETVTDLLAIRTSPWSDWTNEENARVATAVDAPGVTTLMVERLRALLETHA